MNFLMILRLMRLVILFFASALLLTAFFLLKPNREWFNDRIITYYREFNGQYKNMNSEKRMNTRFGSYYTVSRQISTRFIDESKSRNALVLMPSSAYFKARGIDYRVPEPVVFYYFTQIRTVWPNSPNAMKADWYVHVQDGKILIDSIIDRKNLIDTLAVFNQFEISL
jgi:hypothetical protein